MSGARDFTGFAARATRDDRANRPIAVSVPEPFPGIL
jgi:hypothetical protein